METWKANCLCHTDMDVLFCYFFNYGECCVQICLLKASDNTQKHIETEAFISDSSITTIHWAWDPQQIGKVYITTTTII